MSDLKFLKIAKNNLKSLPLTYNYIYHNNLIIPKGEEYFNIKSIKYDSICAAYMSSKPISKIIDFTPIQNEIKKDKK